MLYEVITDRVTITMQLPDSAQAGVDRQICEDYIVLNVITSYSIHYTKLYDTAASAPSSAARRSSKALRVGLLQRV